MFALLQVTSRSTQDTFTSSMQTLDSRFPIMLETNPEMKKRRKEAKKEERETIVVSLKDNETL